ncbi:MAG: hypothetical protein KDA80_07665 [Planctomycetaceae bacterium]|nr:hypothetical protein [Planctomycetaceae bacterium]
MSLYDEYCSGQHASVIHTLAFCWPLAPDESQVVSASNVAVEFAHRAMQNLQLIKIELDSLGYRFLNPDAALVPALPSALDDLGRFEAERGSLPIILKAWYTVFHSIDFRQSPEQIIGKDNNSISPVDGLGFNCDLLFMPFLNCVDNCRSSFRPHTRGGSFLPTGSCGSNYDPKGMNFPTKRFDDVFYNDGSGDVLFTSDMRFVITCCGFPYWWLVSHGVFGGVPSLHATPEYAHFRECLMPRLIPM